MTRPQTHTTTYLMQHSPSPKKSGDPKIVKAVFHLTRFKPRLAKQRPQKSQTLNEMMDAISSWGPNAENQTATVIGGCVRGEEAWIWGRDGNLRRCRIG